MSETEGNVEEGFLDAPDGLRIGWRRWSPTGETRGVVVVLHGIGEHGGRYGEVATRFNDAGYVVAAMDFRGHGRSGGRRGDTRIPPSLSDIDLMLGQEAQRNSGRPLFLYGHSLGGLIAFLYALDRNPDLAGVVLTGPAFRTVLREQRVKVAVARALGSAIPGLTLGSGLPQDLLNRDPAVRAAYKEDPLVHDRASAGFARGALLAQERCEAEAHHFRLPLLIAHGGADGINLLAGSETIAAAVPEDCTLTVYDGVYHALEHEPEMPQIIDDVIAWMDVHRGRDGKSVQA